MILSSLKLQGSGEGVGPGVSPSSVGVCSIGRSRLYQSPLACSTRSAVSVSRWCVLSLFGVYCRCWRFCRCDCIRRPWRRQIFFTHCHRHRVRRIGRRAVQEDRLDNILVCARRFQIRSNPYKWSDHPHRAANTIPTCSYSSSSCNLRRIR